MVIAGFEKTLTPHLSIMKNTSSTSKHQRVKRLLLSNLQEHPEGFWSWMSLLDGRPADKKSANKFMLACILDYQMRYQIVWENARRFAEDDLGDPNDLWDVITSTPQSEWETRAHWKELSLHRFPAGHNRVWRIGRRIVEEYKGDARNIWRGQPANVVVKRLERIGVGPQLSRMTVGGLMDTNQIAGCGDMKADLHTTRVIGRVFDGAKVSEARAHRIAESMLPGDTWRLDFPLFQLGLRVCKAINPSCGECYLMPECSYVKDR